MKRVSMSGSLRENVGKKDAKLNRSLDKVVCVLYGGQEQVHFTVDNLTFNKVIFTPDVHVVDLEIDGKTYAAILQDVQYHPVSDKTLHADFLQVIDGKPITIAVPVKLQGTAPGVMKGGILVKKQRSIPVRGLVNDIPDRIVVDISKLKIGGNIRIRDIDFGKLSCQLNDSVLIVGIKTSRGAVAGADDEEEAEETEGEASAE